MVFPQIYAFNLKKTNFIKQNDGPDIKIRPVNNILSIMASSSCECI